MWIRREAACKASRSKRLHSVVLEDSNISEVRLLSLFFAKRCRFLHCRGANECIKPLLLQPRRPCRWNSRRRTLLVNAIQHFVAADVRIVGPSSLSTRAITGTTRSTAARTGDTAPMMAMSSHPFLSPVKHWRTSLPCVDVAATAEMTSDVNHASRQPAVFI